MKINPLNQSPKLEPLAHEPGDTKHSAKNMLPADSMQILANDPGIGSTIQSLQKLTAPPPLRTDKMNAARELLRSGAIHDPKILEKTAQKILGYDPLSMPGEEQQV